MNCLWRNKLSPSPRSRRGVHIVKVCPVDNIYLLCYTATCLSSIAGAGHSSPFPSHQGVHTRWFGRALDWQSRGQGFDPPRLHPSEQPPSEQSEGVLLYGLLAQRLAQGTHNPWVEGSNPPGPTNYLKAGLHAWPFSIRFAEPFVLLCCLPVARNQSL